MTRDDLDRLAAVVAESNALSPAPWTRGRHVGVFDAFKADVGDAYEGVDLAVIVALRNAAPDLLALAREALEAREASRIRVERAEEWAATLVERAWLDRKRCAHCEGEGLVLCEGSDEDTEECDACAGSGVIDALTLLSEARQSRGTEAA